MFLTLNRSTLQLNMLYAASPLGERNELCLVTRNQREVTPLPVLLGLLDALFGR